MKKQIVLNCNALDYLSTCEDNKFSFSITSPPYNMNLRVRKDKYCSRQIVKEFSTKYDGFDDNLPMDEYFYFHKKILNELLRVTEGYVFYNVQIVTGNKPVIFKLMGEFNLNIKEMIIWDKINAQPAQQFGVMNSQFELILVLSKDVSNSMQRQFKNSNFERGTLSNVWSIKSKKNNKYKDTIHKAVFNDELIDKIIKNFYNKEYFNKPIFDPFSGIGTVGIHCKLNDIDFIGTELVENYANVANERIFETKVND